MSEAKFKLEELITDSPKMVTIRGKRQVCPLVVAREIIGSHFSADYDDDVQVDSVHIGQQEFAGNGGIQFYITTKLLDNARNEIRALDVKDYRKVFQKYYPMADPDISNRITERQLRDHIMSNANVIGLLTKQVMALSNELHNIERRTRLGHILHRDTTIEMAPPPLDESFTPEELHAWLQKVSKWLSHHDFIVPAMKRRPPKIQEGEDLEFGPLSNIESYQEAISRLIQREIDLSKKLSKVEDYYVRAANYINDLLEACYKHIENK
jgi:hypothetical protein